MIRALALALALMAVFAPAALGVSYTVNDSGDASDASPVDADCDTVLGGPVTCTLRAAIEQSNADAVDSIIFSGGIQNTTLAISTALPAITDTLAIDGCAGVSSPTQPCVGVNQTTGGVGAFESTSDDTVIRGLAITGAQFGLFASAADLIVENSWFGVKLDGTTAGANATGIILDSGGNGATIGGGTAATRNVFANNSATGLKIIGGDDNVIQGNYFGVRPDGSTAAKNVLSNIDVAGDASPVDPATGNTIGGTSASPGGACDGVCNVISSARFTNSITIGIDLGGDEVSSPAGQTTISGNYIGLNAAGDAGRGNGKFGILAGSAGPVTIGGPALGDRNYIADSGYEGIFVTGPLPPAITVQNNFSGLNVAGTAAIPNAQVGSAFADVHILSGTVTGNRLAGDATFPIQGPPQGLLVDGTATIRGNVVGVGTGGQNLGFGLAGIQLRGDLSTIGGTGAGDGNVVGGTTSGSEGGISVVGGDANTIQGNFIGTDQLAADHGNAGAGVRITDPGGSDIATDNTVGGNTAASENVISHNGQDAIEIAGDDNDENLIARNRGIDNSGLFIDLTPGDGIGNLAGGANAGVQAPSVTSANASSAAGTASPGATVRVFRRASADSGRIDAFLGQATATGSGAWSLTSSAMIDGHRVVATQTPAASGNTSELSAGLVIDAHAPETTIGSGPSGTTTDDTPTFAFSAGEAGSTFQCGVDGGPFVPCTSPRTLGALADGAHTFRVRARDAAGNLDQSPAARSFTVTTPPLFLDTSVELELSASNLQKALKKKAIVIAAECPLEPCFLVIKATVTLPSSHATAARRLKLKTVRKLLPKGTRKKIKLKIKGGKRKALARALKQRKKLKAKVVVTATDFAGNTTKESEKLKLRR